MRGRLAVPALLSVASLLLLPPLPSAVIVAALGIGTLALGWRSRDLGAWIGAGILLAALCLASQGVVDTRFGGASWQHAGTASWGKLLGTLSDEAARVAGTIAAPQAEGARLASFDVLRARVAELPGSTLLLFDPDGEAVAWAGEGLLHDVAASSPPAGLVALQSYDAVTLVARVPLAGAEPHWHLAVGRSYSRDRWPIDPGPGLKGGAVRWGVRAAGAATDEPDGRTLRLAPAGGPELLLRGPLELPRTRCRGGYALAAFVLASVLLGGALREAAPRGLGSGRGRANRGEAALLATAGCVALAWGFGASLAVLALLAASGLASCLMVTLPWPGWKGAGAIGWLAGTVLPLVAAFVYLAAGGIAPPADSLLSGVVDELLRASLAVPFLAAVWRRSEDGADGAPRALWVGLGLVGLAGALQEQAGVAMALLLAAGALGPTALGLARTQRRPLGWLGVVALAGAFAGVAWQIGGELAARRQLSGMIAAPTAAAAERAAELAEAMQVYLSSEAPGELALGGDLDEDQDLAVAIWRRSPLARRDALSALVVHLPEGGASSFSYGIPLREGGLAAAAPTLRGRVADPALFARGEVRLRPEEPPLRVDFWVSPVEGPIARGGSVGDLVVELLREGPGSRPPRERFVGGAQLVAHASDGEVLVSPWGAAPPLQPDSSGIAQTPAGKAWYWQSVPRAGPVYTLYLPRGDWLAGLEGTAVHVVALLLLAALVAVVAVAAALPERAFRARLRLLVSSYPRRLIAVFAFLVVLPLLVLNLVLVRFLGGQLEQSHRESGAVALVVAQRVLSDYLLALDPGFGLRTALEEDLLTWLSSVVERDVNVYWGSEYFASSRPELFTAGLLPKQIPGEVFSDLALRGSVTAARTRQSGDYRYVELYTVLELPGVPQPRERRFYLSTPLTSQEELVAERLGTVARQATVFTAFLMLLLLAVGTRLAEGFIRPLLEVIEGTDRIARGETSLGLEPSEPELRALVDAIDEMAERIAEGRRQLIREKQVMEQVVENITSAVVSLDRTRRVSMLNEVAAEVLRAGVGQSIDEIAAAAGIEGLPDFLARVRDAAAPVSVRLTAPEPEASEWSAVWVPIPGTGEPAALLVLEDVTEILRGQRLEAWAEMARIIAHEVKNPLTPIRLSTEHMQEVWSSQPDRFREVFERCCRNILVQVDELYEIASDFSTYSRLPEMDLRPDDLVTLVEEVAEPYRAAPPAGVSVVLTAEVATAPVRLDARLLGRAIRNVVENAIRASRGGGEVTISVEADAGGVRVVVADRGPGVPEGDLDRIFEPYFSTFDSGTGLGLAIARRIVVEHGGSITASNREGGGLRVVLVVPHAEERERSAAGGAEAGSVLS